MKKYYIPVITVNEFDPADVIITGSLYLDSVSGYQNKAMIEFNEIQTKVQKASSVFKF